jgi:hypothetical protein
MLPRRPDHLFALLALLGGLLMIAMIPPGAGGSDTGNFQRVLMIGEGQWLVGGLPIAATAWTSWSAFRAPAGPFPFLP